MPTRLSIITICLAVLLTSSLFAKSLKSRTRAIKKPSRTNVAVPRNIKPKAPAINPKSRMGNPKVQSAIASAGTDPHAEAMRACSSCAGAEVQRGVKGKLR